MLNVRKKSEKGGEENHGSIKSRQYKIKVEQNRTHSTPKIDYGFNPNPNDDNDIRTDLPFLASQEPLLSHVLPRFFLLGSCVLIQINLMHNWNGIFFQTSRPSAPAIRRLRLRLRLQLGLGIELGLGLEYTDLTNCCKAQHAL